MATTVPPTEGSPSMTFDPGSRLDPSQVRDVRGRRVGARRVSLAGGGIALVLALAYILLGGDPADLIPPQGVVGGPVTVDTDLHAKCATGSDANAKADCRIVGYVNSVQAYWQGEFQRSGLTYRPSDTVLFSDLVDTGCGTASTQVGPFYCPNDTTIYLDLGFFDELQTRFGATGGSLAQGYVVAHEYGHHVQDLLGDLSVGAGQEGPEGRSVRTELQADCYAGVWASHAAETGFLEPLTEAQIADALDAASSVGDDRIQQQIQGQVNPETWTHGSSAQRQKWFVQGFKTGASDDCDTFGGAI
jgi:predicted metalloprotease